MQEFWEWVQHHYCITEPKYICGPCTTRCPQASPFLPLPFVCPCAAPTHCWQCLSKSLFFFSSQWMTSQKQMVSNLARQGNVKTSPSRVVWLQSLLPACSWTGSNTKHEVQPSLGLSMTIIECERLSQGFLVSYVCFAWAYEMAHVKRNLRTAEVGRDPWRQSSSTSLLRAGSAGAGSSGPWPVPFWVPARVKMPQPLWASSHVLTATQ